jgi:subtilase family serine protease
VRNLICAVAVFACLAGNSSALTEHAGRASGSTPAVGSVSASTSSSLTASTARPKRMAQDTQYVTLIGNTRPEANAGNDRGRVPDGLLMEHIMLQLRRSPQQEQALEAFTEQLNNPTSPNFHQWVTPEEFGERYGLSAEEMSTVTSWLTSHGFTINQVYSNGIMIDFSGTAGQIRETFRTEIHNLEVNGAAHIANMSDPQVPAALAPLVAGIVSLNDFRPHTNYKPRAGYTFSNSDGTFYAVVPADLATIYNLNPLFTAGISGQGQTIVLIEDTDLYTTSDWTTFRSTFGLSSYSGTLTQVHPSGCTDPGVNADDGEAVLDVEWASATAPSAAIELASCADTTTFGGLIALQNLINASNPPAVMSISYGECEAENGASANAAFNSAYEQAASEGVSVFVSSGDEGAASCDADETKATHGIGVSGFASTPYNVAVGGTDFGDTYAGTNSTYWNTTNGTTYGSAKSYVPEIPWNDSCASVLLSTFTSGSGVTYGTSGFCNSSTGEADYLTTASGSGGPSGCATGTASTSGVVSGSCAGYAKPSWQSGFLGNPTDSVRDLPDVSLFAANGVWGHYYVFCWSDPNNGGTPCTGAPSGWSGAGGTSFASPIMAAIQSLVNQKTAARQGNPNPTYYQIAASEYGSGGSSTCNSTLGNGVASSCNFYDVTQGDMDVNCTGTHNCYLPSGTNGVLSTSDSSYLLAYGTATGWNFAAGIGTVNATNLVNNWPSSSQPSFTLSAAPSSLTITQGSNGTSTITVNPIDGFTGSVSLSASGLPSGVTAAFNPTSTTTTSVLTLSASATAATGTATVTITGVSGSITKTTTISLTVNAAAAANFTVGASPSSVTVVQGSNATSTITITSQNAFNSATTLSASGLPSGVTAAFAPNPVTPPANGSVTSTLTFTATATATTGTVTVTITGVSGSLTNTTTISLTVSAATAANFTIGASPSSVTVVQGSNATSTITITSQNSFNSATTLSASGLPSGVTAAFAPNPVTPPANGTVTSTLTFTATGTATTGTFSVTATGTSGSLSHSATITLTVTTSGTGGQMAVYSSTFKAPECATVGISCDSGPSLLLGRDNMSGGAEPNQPNTIGGTCADGTAGVFHSDESNDRIVVATTNGSPLAPGQTVTASATVWAYSNGSADALDLYYASNASSVTWTPIQTGIVPPAGGAQTLSATYTLPSGGSLQAVRAQFRYEGSASSCTTGSYNDHDDLVFAVGAGTPNFTVGASPASVTVIQGSNATSTITVTSQNAFNSAVTLSASGLPSGVTAAFSPSTVTPPANGSATSALTFTASSTAAIGTVNVTVTGASGSLSNSTTIALTVNSSSSGQTAVYSSTLKAPECAAVGISCDSGPTLLLGRDNMSGGAEPNQPNTINNSCADGTAGTFHSDESDDRIVIASTNGGPLTHGQSAKVTATVWAWNTGSSDALDLYYAANANSPTWTYITTIVPPAGGAQSLSATFTLPTGSLQAVRAQFRYEGSASSCTTGSYNDHDDLIFAVN